MQVLEIVGQTPAVVANPDQYIDDEKAARLLGLSPSYMRKLRLRGGGPVYSKFAEKAVRYRVADLLAWASSKSTTSTSAREAA